MPAETHQHRDQVTSDDVLELLLVVLEVPDRSSAGADTELGEVGIDSDLALLDLWDAIVEEFGERTLGEIDLDDLRAAHTVGELAEVATKGWSAGSLAPTDGDEPS
ncbi:hypothetical protein [Rhabdothermincola salaria]|uniref:hypothetical protein n=1 Tax=Rhabdothermincola salaria TaxID=2903142 RepID=UPI001E4712B1|nr:hypothetical protein [Rhabdothermincola salaria]MCD9622262.1 hypothetical protein [Rhabdothermincola salaria]